METFKEARDTEGQIEHAQMADNLVSVYLEAFIELEDLDGAITNIDVNPRFLYGIRKCIFSLMYPDSTFLLDPE